jgi:hypothetical protein
MWKIFLQIHILSIVGDALFKSYYSPSQSTESHVELAIQQGCWFCRPNQQHGLACQFIM